MGIFNHHTKAKHSMLSKTHYPQHEAVVLLSAAAPGRLVKVEGKINSAKIHRNPAAVCKRTATWDRIIFHQDDDPAHKAKAPQESGLQSISDFVVGLEDCCSFAVSMQLDRA